MATFTNTSKNSASFTNTAQSAVSTTYYAGSPLGLLLTLTWDSENVVSGISWTNTSKN